MIGARIILIHTFLHQEQTEDADIVIKVLLRRSRNRGNVMDSFDGSHNLRSTSDPMTLLEINDLENSNPQHKQHHTDVTPRVIKFWHIPGQLPSINLRRKVHPINTDDKRERDKDGG